MVSLYHMELKLCGHSAIKSNCHNGSKYFGHGNITDCMISFQMDCSTYLMDHTTTCIGKAVPQLQTPAFLVDLRKATKNCQEMKDSCKGLGLSFRPVTSAHRTQYV